MPGMHAGHSFFVAGVTTGTVPLVTHLSSLQLDIGSDHIQDRLHILLLQLL